MTPRLMPFLVAVTMLAGCSSGSDGPDVPDVAPATPALGFEACSQFHTFFASPKSGFEPFVPEGFSMKDADPAGLTTTVDVFASSCGNTTELWGLLEVVPRNAYANGSLAVEAVILQALTSNATDLTTYQAWGIGDRIAHADAVTLDAIDGMVARDESITLAGGGLSYTVRTLVASEEAAFAPTAYRYWIQDGTTVSGYLLVENGAGTSLGAGSAFFTQEGDPGAPPATAGVGHRVAGVDVRVTHVPWRA